MKRTRTLFAGLATAAILATVAWGAIVYQATLVSTAGLATDTNYSLDLRSKGIGSVTAQANYSTATFAQVTFTDGQAATGSITITSYADMVPSAATNTLTVLSNTGIIGTRIMLPGRIFKEGVDWRRGSSTALSATSLAAAIATYPGLSVSRSGSVIYTTMTATGVYWNSYTLASSTPAAVAAGGATFSGGRDNAVLTINGVRLRQGKEFNAATSNSQTATNIKNAIDGNAQLAKFSTVTANSIGAGVVGLTTKKVGAIMNFPISASGAGIVATTPLLINGTNASWTLGQKTIAISGHGMTLGLPVLYSSGAFSIGGLTDQTTYYVAPISANSLSLATSKVNASAGTYITLTSSAVPAAAHSFTLAALPIAGNTTLQWQTSNDNATWFNLGTSSVIAPTDVANSILWELGAIGSRYLRLKTTAPTAGGMGLTVTVVGQ